MMTAHRQQGQEQEEDTTTVRSQPASRKPGNRAQRAIREKAVTFAIIVIGSGFLGVGIGGGWGALAGVVAGLALAGAFTRG